MTACFTSVWDKTRNTLRGKGSSGAWILLSAGDVSATLVIDENGNRVPHRRLQALDARKGEREIPNPNSAVVWNLQTQDVSADGEIDYEEEMHRVVASPTIRDDLVIVADFSGVIYCIDAKTGRQYWTHDQLSPTWGSPLVADGKIYVGDEDGDVTIFRLGKQKSMINEIYMQNSIKIMPIVANDILYVATLDTLYAIEEQTPSPEFSQRQAVSR